MNQDVLLGLKRLAWEKGYKAELSQVILKLIPSDPKKNIVSFPLDEIEIAEQWLALEPNWKTEN
jgi:hypothetical protein